MYQGSNLKNNPAFINARKSLMFVSRVTKMSFEFVCRCMVVCYILCIRILIVCSIFVCIQEVTVYQSSYSVLYLCVYKKWLSIRVSYSVLYLCVYKKWLSIRVLIVCSILCMQAVVYCTWWMTLWSQQCRFHMTNLNLYCNHLYIDTCVTCKYPPVGPDV